MNGIGGCTIEEAKKNLSISEIAIWSEYRKRRGSLNIGRRVEQAIGSYHAAYVSFKTGNPVEPIKFMPHEDQPKEMSLEEYMMQAYGGE